MGNSVDKIQRIKIDESWILAIYFLKNIDVFYAEGEEKIERMGRVKVWLAGEEIVNFEGPVGRNDGRTPYRESE